MSSSNALDCWGQLWADDIATTVAISTGGEYKPFKGFTDRMVAGGQFVIGTTDNSTSDRLIIGQYGKGTYRATFTCSFSGSVGNKNYHIALHRNSSKLPMTSIERKIGTAGDVGAVSGCGLISLHTNDYLDLRFFSSAASTIIINHANMSIHRVVTATSTSI